MSPCVVGFYKTLSALTLAGLASALAAGGCAAQDVIYRQPMPGNKILVVERHEMPYVETLEDKSFIAHLPPGETTELPKYTYIYSYTLTSKGSKQRKVLWNQITGSSTKILPGPGPIEQGSDNDANVIVLNVAIQGDVLIVAYKQGLDTLTNVITPDSKGGRKQMPAWDAKVWNDPIYGGTYIQAADITGSLKQHTLTVTLTDHRGGKYPFLYQNGKWVKQFHMHPNADKTEFTPGP